MRAVFRIVTTLWLAVGLAACSTTGRSFNAEALGQFVPGQTTYAQAVQLLGAEPVNTYAQLNGTLIARWAQKASVLTDAIYVRRELMLRFSPDGRFEAVVDKVNVIADPKPQQPVSATMPPAPSPLPQANPELQKPLSSSVVTYPVPH